jgi:hypothetical protein
VLFNDSWGNRVGMDLLDDVLADYPRHAAAARPQSGGTYHSYPEPADIAAVRAAGLRLVAPRDFAAAVRGTGAEHPGSPAAEATGATAVGRA